MTGSNASDKFQTGLHPVVFVGAVTMAALVGLATMFVVRNNDLAPSTTAGVIVGGGLLMVLSVLPTAVRWARATFAVEADRFSGRVGWLRPHALDLPWEGVADADLDQTWLGQRFGYGTIRLLTTDQVVDGFSHVARAPELLHAVRARLGMRSRSRAAR